MSEASIPGVSSCGAGVTRRRTFRIVAVAAGLPLMIAALRATVPAGQLFNWQGEVLGGARRALAVAHRRGDRAPRHPQGRSRDRAVRRHFQPRPGGERNLAAQCGGIAGAAVDGAARADGGGPSVLRAQRRRVRYLGAAAVAALRGAFLVGPEQRRRGARRRHPRPRPRCCAGAGRLPPNRDRSRAHRLRPPRDGRDAQ